MNYQDEVIRSLIRGLGWRVTRGLPFWLAALILLALWMFGGK